MGAGGAVLSRRGNSIQVLLGTLATFVMLAVMAPNAMADEASWREHMREARRLANTDYRAAMRSMRAAEDEAANFALTDEKSIETLRLLADIQAANERAFLAEEALREAIGVLSVGLGEEHPRTLEERLHLADFYLSQNQRGEAIIEMRNVFEVMRMSPGKFPNWYQVGYRLAGLLFQARQYSEAREILSLIEPKYSKETQPAARFRVLRAMAETLIGLGEIEEAQRVYRNAQEAMNLAGAAIPEEERQRAQDRLRMLAEGLEANGGNMTPQIAGSDEVTSPTALSVTDPEPVSLTEARPAPAPEPQWVPVIRFTGSMDGSTRRFQVPTSQWRIRYKADPTGDPEKTIFGFLLRKDGEELPVSNMMETGAVEGMMPVRGAGTYYFHIQCDRAEYQIVVERPGTGG